MAVKTTKIVFMGAGSASFGLSVFRDLFTSKELSGSTLTLVDINENNLMLMYNLAVKMNELSGADLKIKYTMDKRKALLGAEFVVNSIAIKRGELWEQDFLIPKKYGIRHTLGENGGPGGLFFTMRTLPVIIDIMKDMEELCPNAYFINFSNPENRIILAVGNYTRIKAVGLCHGVFMARSDVARIMGVDYNNIEIWAAGLNHFQWLLEIRDKSTGKDMYPLLKEKNKTYDPSFEPLSRKLFQVFGLYPSCSDSHIGEYLSYGWEGGEKGYDFKVDKQHREILKDQIIKKTRREMPMKDWITQPSGEKAIEVITSILYNKKKIIESGIVINNGAISNLPDDAAVEVPIMVDGGGIHPISMGALPIGIASLLGNQVDVQKMAVRAALDGSKELALQALLIDPVINSIKAAEKILEEEWQINKPYIRKTAFSKKNLV